MRGYDLDRDGQRFLLTRTRRRPAAEITRINLIQNWFVELKAKVPVRQGRGNRREAGEEVLTAVGAR
jgi:hypothetical protein